MVLQLTLDPILVEAPGKPPIRTVLVDDCQDVRFLLATLLELDGRFEVIGEAASSRDALELLGSVRPDLIVVDLRLGRYDGASLIRALRDRGHDTRIAVLTGSPHQYEHDAAVAAGADSVLTKDTVVTTMAADLLELMSH